jgi:hypothetical protein
MFLLTPHRIPMFHLLSPSKLFFLLLIFPLTKKTTFVSFYYKKGWEFLRNYLFPFIDSLTEINPERLFYSFVRYLLREGR